MSPVRPLSAHEAQVQAATDAVTALAEHANAGDRLLEQLADAVVARRPVRSTNFWDSDGPLEQLTLVLTPEQVAALEDATGRAITTRTVAAR